MLRAASLLAWFTITASVAVGQQIYKTTDEHGNVIFTDQPPASTSSSQPVDLPQTNITPATPVRPSPTPEPIPEEPAAPELSVAITVPANETTIPMGPGNFSVTVDVKPGLDSSSQLQLYMDGVPWGDPQRGTSWALTNVFRGAHDITVAVVDEGGKHLAGSDPIRVYVLRPSINMPARRANN